VEDYGRALELRPDDAGIHFKRGSLLLHLALAGKRPQPKLLIQARGDFSKVVEGEGLYRARAEARLREIQTALSN